MLQKPTAREGHSAQAWGNASMVLFGGWGGGIRNDLYVLASPLDGGTYKWSPPAVLGERPAVR